MRLAVHSIAANEHDSKRLEPLIIKLVYNTKEIYTDKGYQDQPTFFTLIVETSKTVYRKKL
ncbi:MAG: hypothetical protein ACMUEL_07520 [Flavobacteriales bacterium Tduv]